MHGSDKLQVPSMLSAKANWLAGMAERWPVTDNKGQTKGMKLWAVEYLSLPASLGATGSGVLAILCVDQFSTNFLL